MMASIRVLVVDDSAFARKVLREVLATSPLIEVVGWARDGLDALEKIAELRPDVITLDLVMPNLDGLGVLRALPSAGAPRVVVVSMADEDSDLGVAALQGGAIDLVQKPTALAVDRLYEMSAELIQKVIAASRARAPGPVVMTRVESTRPAPRAASEGLVVMGASTGGPQALTRVLTALPADFPAPIAVVLHIPQGYTEPFANRLNDECALRVVEAAEGTILRPGLVVVARAGIHLKLTGSGNICRAMLDSEPIQAAHRPSVDALFESAAIGWGNHVLGVILTGMGDDGLIGSRAIHAAGGALLTEAESSCVVYGMPRAVFEAGLDATAFRLGEMAKAILARF
jgi:two-component system chemotaxis response regulator CheB